MSIVKEFFALRYISSAEDRRLAVSGIGSVAIKVTGTLFGLLSAILLARSLGPSGYGVYAYVFAMVSAMAIPVQFGLPNLLVRETARGQVNQSWSLVAGLWRWSAFATLAFSAIVIVCAFGISRIVASRFSELQLATFYWGLLLIPLIGLGNLRGAALQGLHRVVLGQLPEQILRPGLWILFLLIAITIDSARQLTATFAMLLHVVAAFIAFLVGGWLLWRNRPKQMTARLAPDFRTREWVASAIPLAFTASMFLVNTYAGIILLGIFRASEEVGIYRVAVTGGTLVVFVLSAVNTVVAPHLARYYAARELMRLQDLTTASARVSVALAAPIFLILLFWGADVIRLVFGAGFVSAYEPLVLLSIGQLVNAAMGPVGVLLNMTGRERDTARAVTISAVANLVLSLLLIPFLGATGAALATAIALAIWNILMWRTARTRLGIESSAVRVFGIHRNS